VQQHSTAYIIGFMAAVCLVCSIFVAGSAVSLKSRQQANEILDRQKKVLVVAGLMEDGERITSEEVSRRYDANITARVVELETGSYAADMNAESYDQQKAAKDPKTSKPAPENPAKVLRLPKYGTVFQVKDESGSIVSVIIPIEGVGLWSTLYGYLALAPDTRTIQGINFYQHGETPGLGGEVDNPIWKSRWAGRLAFDDRWIPRISVIKGQAGPPDQDPYRVDGLSGATITSRGVDNLVRFWLGDSGWGPYLEQVRGGAS
jgi:Na+-transporting NADH:ubiquinone oxidoreductase subunit C